MIHTCAGPVNAEKAAHISSHGRAHQYILLGDTRSRPLVSLYPYFLLFYPGDKETSYGVISADHPIGQGPRDSNVDAPYKSDRL